MVGIDPGVMCHRLNIFPNYTGIRQKCHSVSEERAIALKEEVDRLLKVGLIKESFYPEWLANLVLVKKLNGKWRMCVDFIDLNKACPNDSFPLPRIDQLVDVTAGHALLSFMDAGIEANPAKIQALLDMKSPTSVKQVQSLIGWIAALNRFVSKSSDRYKEFFKAIKVAGKDFVGMPECEEAFRKIKNQLGNPPMLSKPLEGESLILYLAV
ncbi:uncharacterized protein LOC141673987 [Apium graveolens]|uniref:uncharacterized protein LOC141673987 n=1 Tax=Apium graveolens TaxID=4045 RepID=UPI003D78D661